MFQVEIKGINAENKDLVGQETTTGCTKTLREIINDILGYLMLGIGMFISDLRVGNEYMHMESVDKIHVGSIYRVEEELIISHCVTLSPD